MAEIQREGTTCSWSHWEGHWGTWWSEYPHCFRKEAQRFLNNRFSRKVYLILWCNWVSSQRQCPWAVSHLCTASVMQNLGSGFSTLLSPPLMDAYFYRQWREVGISSRDSAQLRQANKPIHKLSTGSLPTDTWDSYIFFIIYFLFLFFVVTLVLQSSVKKTKCKSDSQV